VFRIEVNHVKTGFFFASKRNEIFASISNFASEAKVRAHPSTHLRGASKIKLKKVNKKRMVTFRRVIILLNISRHPLLICLHCSLRQYKTLKAVAMAMAVIVVLTPAKNLNKVFWGF
jgi:hypothetical protein